MATRVFTIDPDVGNAEAVREAAACISAGGLVVMPTETVYGLAADVTHAAALARLREVKGRDAADKPFTVHIGSRAAVDRFVPNLTGLARRLVQKAWPGPLTIVFSVADPRQAPVIRESSPTHIPDLYREGTIGIRCPDDRIAADVLTQAGGTIVATSANPGGAPPPVTADEALAALDGRVDLVLDAGRTRYARASTIVRIDGNDCTIVREGILDKRAIRRLCSVNFLLVCTGNTCRSPMAAALLRRLLAQRLGCGEAQLPDRGYQVESAGVGACDGVPASESAMAVMRDRGLDLTGHRSAALTLEAIQRADYIWTMTASHLRAVAAMSPAAVDRCRLLDDQEVEDPIGEDETVYARCADRIEQALRRLFEEISL